MNIERDPARRLREANPVDPDDVKGPDSPQAQALLNRIVRTPLDVEPKRRAGALRRHMWILVPAAILVLGAAGYGFLRSVTQPTLFACYPQQNLSNGRELSGADPVAVCNVLWQAGAAFNPHSDPPPHLSACVLLGGGIGVFPDSPDPDACAALGLARPAISEAQQREIDALGRAQGVISERFVNACMARADAIAFVRAELAHEGLDDWGVEVRGTFTQEEPCASMYPDFANRRFRIVPVPKAPSP